MKAILLMGHGGLEMLRYGKAPDPTAESCMKGLWP